MNKTQKCFVCLLDTSGVETESTYVVQTGIKCMIFLPRTPEYWDCI